MTQIKVLLLLLIFTVFATSCSNPDSYNQVEPQTSKLKYNSSAPGQYPETAFMVGRDMSKDFTYSDYRSNTDIYQRGYLYQVYYDLTVSRPMNLQVYLTRSYSSYSNTMWIHLSYKSGTYKTIECQPSVYSNIELTPDIKYVGVYGANSILSSGKFDTGHFNVQFKGTVK